MVRIECPTCHTSYTADQCGVQPGSLSQRVTVVCVVCRKTIDAIIEPIDSRWTRYRTGETHTVTSRHER